MSEPADGKEDAPGVTRNRTPAREEALRNHPHRRESSAGDMALIGKTIGGRYRIECVVGEGGMGVVYKAEHTLMRKRTAIKVLHPEMTRLPEAVARFEREAMAAAHIDHPHVVTATDFGKLDDGSFFLALEFVEGKGLREVIAEGRLELGRALHIGYQIASALSRAHALKIVHRDLKPENVMLVERDGDPDFVKVLDFGIAKVQIGEFAERPSSADPGQPMLTQSGMIYGTPGYMAPEQALGQPVDARADLYALGIILYEMLTGVRPFAASSAVALLGMQVTAPVPPMAQKNPDAGVPPEVEAFVGRLLAKEADGRPGDARDVVDAMIAIQLQLANAGVIDPRYAPPPPSLPPSISATGSSISLAPPNPVDPDGQPEEPSALARLEALLAGKSWLAAAGAGVLGIIVLVATIVAVRSGRAAKINDAADASIDASDVASATPLDRQIADAIAMIERGDYGSGIKQLEELGDSADGRDDVRRALLVAYGATDRSQDAMREAGAILKANPNLDVRRYIKLRIEIRDTAIKEGNKVVADKPAVDEAFSLLANRMGTIGWDDLYDIAYGVSGAQYPKAAARARAILQKGDRAKMTPALAVTVDLQAAGMTCNAKALFDRAQNDGDERTLAFLKQMVPARYPNHWHWSKKDALACVHEGSLTRTISALENRLRTQKKK
ncbi:MAG: serine/threonine protein kinase [Polyangiaceae bacterium]|nr:serine/threonine protein kinase [Polyangiaceae bacterium]